MAKCGSQLPTDLLPLFTLPLSTFPLAVAVAPSAAAPPGRRDDVKVAAAVGVPLRAVGLQTPEPGCSARSAPPVLDRFSNAEVLRFDARAVRALRPVHTSITLDSFVVARVIHRHLRRKRDAVEVLPDDPVRQHLCTRDTDPPVTVQVRTARVDQAAVVRPNGMCQQFLCDFRHRLAGAPGRGRPTT